MQLAMPQACPGQAKAQHTQGGGAWTPSPKTRQPQTHSEMHSGPDAPAGQSTRHSEVGRATAGQTHLGYGWSLRASPQLLVLLELGRWVLTLDSPDAHRWPDSVWGCWEACAQTVKYSLFGWAGHGEGREGLA